MPESLVLLHGFSGTRHAWDRVTAQLSAQRYTPLALDLPGHGDAVEQDAPIGFDSCVAHVLARSPERFALCGYSLGGRVALHLALSAPERVSHLVLVSMSAGIADPAETGWLVGAAREDDLGVVTVGGRRYRRRAWGDEQDGGEGEPIRRPEADFLHRLWSGVGVDPECHHHKVH